MLDVTEYGKTFCNSKLIDTGTNEPDGQGRWRREMETYCFTTYSEWVGSVDARQRELVVKHVCSSYTRIQNHAATVRASEYTGLFAE